MKVKIVMEAEVSDLPAFNPNTSVFDIREAGAPNIRDVIKALWVNALMKLMKHKAIITFKDPELEKAYVKAYEDEVKLTERLTEHIRVTFFDLP